MKKAQLQATKAVNAATITALHDEVFDNKRAMARADAAVREAIRDLDHFVEHGKALRKEIARLAAMQKLVQANLKTVRLRKSKKHGMDDPRFETWLASKSMQPKRFTKPQQ